MTGEGHFSIDTQAAAEESSERAPNAIYAGALAGDGSRGVNARATAHNTCVTNPCSGVPLLAMEAIWLAWRDGAVREGLEPVFMSASVSTL